MLNPEKKYNLIPASWLAKWRSFVTCTGKNISSSPEPDSLEIIIDSLMCEKVHCVLFACFPLPFSLLLNYFYG